MKAIKQDGMVRSRMISQFSLYELCFEILIQTSFNEGDQDVLNLAYKSLNDA
jgi:hypothetical protein